MLRIYLNIGLNKYVKINFSFLLFTLFILLFSLFKGATRKFKIAPVAVIVFLLASTVVEECEAIEWF